MQTKHCPKCGIDKPITEFYKKGNSNDGLSYQCKECQREYMHNYFLKNKARTTICSPSEKQCPTCGIIKPASEFGKDSTKNDGLRSQCQDCQNARCRIYRREYYQTHKEEEQKKDREYRRKNREYIRKKAREHRQTEQYMENSREYRQKNKEKLRKYERERYQKNREHYKEYMRKRWQTHKELYRGYNRKYRHSLKGKISIKRMNNKRRALTKDKDSDLNHQLWRSILKQQGNICNVCRKPFTTKRQPTLDHIIPLSRGGSLTSDNLQALCLSCNRIKHDKIDKNFIQTWINHNV